ncbi:hypothetical protein PMZ80_002920 [Knufia obscura]|uniref:Uncharacterized protein n=1 Tax=Knufia obscura TaxID=1635080 RepID=A0ABR0RZL3_9EURO|nr:hypothetical protein PMZ80_002920 [Knufia obscura]
MLKSKQRPPVTQPEPFSTGLTLAPTTLHQVKAVKESTSDQTPHEYTLELARPAETDFTLTESQLISAAPFRIGQIVAQASDMKTKRTLYKVTARYIRDTMKVESGKPATAHNKMLSDSSIDDPALFSSLPPVWSGTTATMTQPRPPLSRTGAGHGTKLSYGPTSYKEFPNMKDVREQDPQLAQRAQPPHGGQRFVSMLRVMNDFGEELGFEAGQMVAASEFEVEQMWRDPPF